MIQQKLENFMKKRRATLLGVGPMSQNCVDATIELANEFDVPLMLIASRRQIECREYGGGYVNNWSTEDFSNYVLKNDKKGKILLARDHGGPWQNPKEVKEDLSLRLAMESAKKSYAVDIQSGFQVIHIDPSIDIHGKPPVDEILDRVYELYEFCWGEARRQNKEIIFEVGTEEQSGGTNSVEELEYVLNEITNFCRRNALPQPTFVVVQTGTRVMEMRNVGSFDSPFRIANELPAEIQVPRMLDICRKFGTFMKEHNTDYLSDESLSWHPRLGIHAANVAPEFGVTESKALVEVLTANHLEPICQKFLELAYQSKKWDKWMVPNTKATDVERSLIAGHYVFSNPAFLELKKEAEAKLAAKGVNLNEVLKRKVKDSIYRYVRSFRIAGAQ